MALKAFNEAGEEITIPSKKEVCERCHGEGKHVNPNIDGHGLSREDFDEDPDFEEAYFSGVYDVACEECKGLRVVDSPDFKRMNQEQNRAWDLRCQYLNELAHERELRARGIEY